VLIQGNMDTRLFGGFLRASARRPETVPSFPTGGPGRRLAPRPRRTGLKVSRLNILIVTAKLGLARPAQVCEILQLDVSTLSRNVKPVQAHGGGPATPSLPAAPPAAGSGAVPGAAPALPERLPNRGS
jgi:hypothetical protein